LELAEVRFLCCLRLKKGVHMSDAPSVYTKNGIIYVRASAFGSCVRKLWAVYDGVQPMEHTDKTKRVFEEGHLHEAAVTEQLTQEGYVIHGDQHVVDLPILKNRLHIVGHIDGFINMGTSTEYDQSEYGSEDRLWECKSMSRNAFDDWTKKRFDYRPGYAWQLAIYMLGTETLQAHYSVKRRDDGVIDTMLIAEPPKSMTEIRSRALTIYNVLRNGEMPDCDVDGGQKWFCEYWFLHEEEDIEIKEPEIPVDEIPELANLLAEYNEVNETAKWADAEKKRLKAKLQDEFRNGRDVFASDLHKVRIQHGTRKTLDKAALIAGEKNGQELVEKYTKESATESWYVTPRKG